MKKTALIPLVALLASTAAFAGDKTYEVTITNITAGQTGMVFRIMRWSWKVEGSGWRVPPDFQVFGSARRG